MRTSSLDERIIISDAMKIRKGKYTYVHITGSRVRILAFLHTLANRSMEVASKDTMIITNNSSGSLFRKTGSSSFSGSNRSFRVNVARRLAKSPVATEGASESTGFNAKVVSTAADKSCMELDSVRAC